MKKFLVKLLIRENKIVSLFEKAEDLYRHGNGSNKHEFVLDNIKIPKWIEKEYKEHIQVIFGKHQSVINRRTMQKPVRMGKLVKDNKDIS